MQFVIQNFITNCSTGISLFDTSNHFCKTNINHITTAEDLAIKMMRGNIRRKKKSSLSIKIKPFSKPPVLPEDFYQSSSSLLWASLHSILQKRSTLFLPASKIEITPPSPTTSAADPVKVNIAFADYATYNDSIPTPMPSMEELFGKVQDLCTHGFGPKLYLELVAFLDHAAFACASRLQNDLEMSETGGAPVYPTKNCALNAEKNALYFTSLDEEKPASEGSVILQNIWTMYADFLQFLNCVRSIFLSLDRMFLYLPPGRGQVEARLLMRNSNASSAVVAAQNLNDNSGLLESSRGSTFVDLNATAGAAWDMWDVGMNCLCKHLIVANSAFDVAGKTLASATASISSQHMMEYSTSESKRSPEKDKYSILHALKERTIKCIVAELELSADKSSSADVNMASPGGSTSNSSPEMLDKSLIRNCVSIFRALAHVSTDVNGTNANQDLLQNLVKAMTVHFQKESLQWVSESESNTAPSKTSYDASALLNHIDNRIKQVHDMTNYYHLASDTAADAPSQEYMTYSLRKRQNKILINLVEEFVLTPHFNPQLLLHLSNLYPILDNEEESIRKDAGLLYQLSKRVIPTSSHASNTASSSSGANLLRQSFEAYGKERGTAIMLSTSLPQPIPTAGLAVKPPPQMTMREKNDKIIDDLLQFKAHLEFLCTESFGNDADFSKTCRKVLEDVLNNIPIIGVSDMRRRGRYGNDTDGGKRIAELLAKYLDLRFKSEKASLSSLSKIIGRNGMLSSSSGNSDDDVETFQNAVLELFRHIQSKDVFEAFYRQDLSKRLLLKKSTSIDAERAFVSKLKGECGTGYTSKMEGMFKDMELSKDVMSNYSAHLIGLGVSATAPTSGKIGMDVQLLTTGYWPVHTQHPSLILPSTLESKKLEFDTYYKSKYQGRRIVWQNGFGNCIVKANFPRIEAMELNVSLCQALVLLCFNLDESGEEIRLTVGEVMQKTGISDKGEAERVLQSLSMGRDGTQVLHRIHSKENPSDQSNTETTPRKKHKSIRKAVSEKDIFVFNDNFTSKQRRIRITNIQMKETSRDRKKTHESVILDRLHLTDAAIVRIMKARKSLEHRDLVGEVMSQLKFPANGVDVKKRIESLIEREYLERVEGDSSRYNYLA